MRVCGWGIAALCAAAVFACTGAAAYRGMEAGQPQLVIEVIAQGEETDAAALINGKPSVLIYHTHTWEAYEMTQEAQYSQTERWRTKDEQHNMVRIGEELARLLADRGFYVVHDRTAFEPPNLSDAYVRSLEMLETRIGQGEQYDYILDVHRDAYSGDWNGDNCVTDSGGDRSAYVMLLVGKGVGTTGAGFDARPDWPVNLALAQEITGAMNQIRPGIGRDVKIKSGRFNQHVSTGALLIEVGNNKNVLSDALNACPVIADALLQVHMERTAQP